MARNSTRVYAIWGRLRTAAWDMAVHIGTVWNEEGRCKRLYSEEVQAIVRSTQDGMCKDAALNILLTFIRIFLTTP
jgi:hypothetical protein